MPPSAAASTVFLISDQEIEVLGLPGQPTLQVARGLRLHLRAKPGDWLVIIQPKWPYWVKGTFAVVTLELNGTIVHVKADPEASHWHPTARVGVIGAYYYASFMSAPAGLGEKPLTRLTPEQAERLWSVLSQAPRDRDTCYCGECRQLRDTENFLKEGHSICKTCQSRHHYQRYGRVRRAAVRESTTTPLTELEWADCLAFFGFVCAYCEGDGGGELTKDHLLAIWEGGRHEQANVVPACRRCNSKKSDREMEPWFRSMPFFTEERLNRILEWSRVPG